MNRLAQRWLHPSAWALIAAVVGGAAINAEGYTITGLSSPFEAGDYAVSATPGGNLTMLVVRPTNPASTQVVFNSGTLSSEVSVGGTFNHSTGDFFYWSGYSGSYGGYLLQEIKAGQTASSTAISDMRINSYGGSIVAVTVGSDNTVYDLQGNGVVAKFTPNGLGGYNAGTQLATINTSAWPGATIRTITSGTAKDQYLLVAPSYPTGSSPYSQITSINTTSGAESAMSGVQGTDPIYQPMSVAVDYNHPFNDGTLRVLVSNVGALSGTDTAVRRITELAFNPVTGVLTNPAAGGTGNGVPGNFDAESVVTSGDIPDSLQFDNQGNLVVVSRWQNQYGYSLTPAQLYPESTATNLSSGATVWAKSSLSGSPDLYSMRSLDIAPIVPEPASLGLGLLGLGLLAGCRCRDQRNA